MYHYLLTVPKDLAQAKKLGLPLVHLAFSIGPEGVLRQEVLSPACRGGLMLAGTKAAPRDGSAAQAVRDILRLCRDRDFRGVVLDIGSDPSPFISRLIQGLDRGLQQMNRGFFLPELFSNFSERAFLYVSSSVSGGSLEKRLQELTARYRPDRLVLALERAAEDFPLPAHEGSGRRLDQDELDTLRRRLRPRTHFDHDLLMYYFTYLDRRGFPRLVLFDRADSLQKKQELAERLGIRRFFLLYSQADGSLCGNPPDPTPGEKEKP